MQEFPRLHTRELELQCSKRRANLVSVNASKEHSRVAVLVYTATSVALGARVRVLVLEGHAVRAPPFSHSFAGNCCGQNFQSWEIPQAGLIRVHCCYLALLSD